MRKISKQSIPIQEISQTHNLEQQKHVWEPTMVSVNQVHAVDEQVAIAPAAPVPNVARLAFHPHLADRGGHGSGQKQGLDHVLVWEMNGEFLTVWIIFCCV